MCLNLYGCLSIFFFFQVACNAEVALFPPRPGWFFFPPAPDHSVRQCLSPVSGRRSVSAGILTGRAMFEAPRSSIPKEHCRHKAVAHSGENGREGQQCDRAVARGR